MMSLASWLKKHSEEFQALLLKPFGLRELKRAVEKALRWNRFDGGFRLN